MSAGKTDEDRTLIGLTDAVHNLRVQDIFRYKAMDITLSLLKYWVGSKTSHHGAQVSGCWFSVFEL